MARWSGWTGVTNSFYGAYRAGTHTASIRLSSGVAVKIYMATLPKIKTTSKSLRELRLLIKRNSPVKSGRLKRSWNDPRTVQARPDGSIEIDNPLPYARIQDLGGDIRPYDIVEEKGPGHVMRAVIDGKVRFFTSRKGFTLPGSQYVQRAIVEWLTNKRGDARRIVDPDMGKTLLSQTALQRIRGIRERQQASAARAKITTLLGSILLLKPKLKIKEQ